MSGISGAAFADAALRPVDDLEAKGGLEERWDFWEKGRPGLSAEAGTTDLRIEAEVARPAA